MIKKSITIDDVFKIIEERDDKLSRLTDLIKSQSRIKDITKCFDELLRIQNILKYTEDKLTVETINRVSKPKK